MNDKKLLQYIHLLGLTNEEFANYLEVSYDTLKNWLYRNKEVPKRKVEFVINKIKLHKNYTQSISNEEFLSHLPDPEPRITEADVYKKLEELKKKKSKSNTEPSSRIVNDDDLIDAVEYRVPWKGQAGLASKFYPDEMIEQLSRNVIRVKPEYKGVYFTIEVDGNSMPPQIQPGDWLRCEEISSLFWLEKNFFKKDKIYCIWHNSRGIIFKRLIYKNSGEIWCSSDNEDKLEFPDFPLEIEKVNKILVVRSLVDRKF